MDNMTRDEQNERDNQWLRRNYEKVQTYYQEKKSGCITKKAHQQNVCNLGNSPVKALIMTINILSDKGMTQRKIAEHLKISLGTVNKFLNI